MQTTARPSRLYSIGHSNHTIERLLELLAQHGIEAVADVRSSPYSQHNPQFSREKLEQSLKGHGVAYVFLGAELGARREEPECYHDGKIDYDRVAQTPAFRRGLGRLAEGAAKMHVAMMCAEKDPLECHRSILIARHIKDIVDDLLHILPDGSVESQSQIEQRLLVEYNLNQNDLFGTPREQRLLDAYRQRESEIAYEEPALHG